MNKLTIKIQLNNDELEIPSGLSLSQLLSNLSLSDKGTALAINSEIIPKDKWPTTTIDEACNILLVQAAQGG